MDEKIASKLRQANIDVNLTEAGLQLINQRMGKAEAEEKVHLPQVEAHPAVVNLVGGSDFCIERRRAHAHLQHFPAMRAELAQMERLAHTGSDTQLRLNQAQLQQLGRCLFSEFAFGVFNGGSASSYFDQLRNRKYAGELFELFRDRFEDWRQRYASLPKGLTPAFVRAEDQAPTFLEFKLRSLFHLSLCAAEQGATQQFERPIGFFQMTGTQSDAPIQQAMGELQYSPLLAEALQRWPLQLSQLPRAVQPLVAAITHSQQGYPRQVFFDAAGLPLALPGGHGQCFVTLKEVFRQLRAQGYRYISLGNIDNLGYTPDAVVLALLALSGAHAAFCGSHKTAVDTKGGVILENEQGRFTCRDLGAGVDPTLIAQAEAAGHAVLFNCAIGYFNLDYLLAQLDSIIASLPLRVIDQQKDRGSYAQMEQVTWEVIGLIDQVLVVGVEKRRRFLAAKLVLENFINSGYRLDSYPTNCGTFRSLACELSSGLADILAEDCGMSRKAVTAL